MNQLGIDASRIIIELSITLDIKESMIAALLNVTHKYLSSLKKINLDLEHPKHTRLIRLYAFVKYADRVGIDNIYNLLHEPITPGQETIMYYIVDTHHGVDGTQQFYQMVQRVVCQAMPTPEV